MMESNLCDGDHSDSNVLLPPRKRLLAGFKKLNSDHNPGNLSSSKGKGVSDTQIDALTKYHLENPNLSLKEIVEESRRAAEQAVKVAVAARAVAEEKAIIAAKAMARAKSALELVDDISDEVYGDNRYSKKNKMKKHVPVKTLYNKNGNVKNRNTDEKLALRLHHAMNSSPRIAKNLGNSNLKTRKHKKLKGLSIIEGPRVSSNGHCESESEETDSEDLTGEVRVVGVSECTLKSNTDKSSKIVNGKAESSRSKEIRSDSSDDFSSDGRKRKMKQKKLPLSICSFRDLVNTKEETKSKGVRPNGENKGKNAVAPSFAGAHSDTVMAAKPTSMWKCKPFKARDCVKQNKVMEP